MVNVSNSNAVLKSNFTSKYHLVCAIISSFSSTGVALVARRGVGGSNLESRVVC